MKRNKSAIMSVNYVNVVCVVYVDYVIFVNDVIRVVFEASHE